MDGCGMYSLMEISAPGESVSSHFLACVPGGIHQHNLNSQHTGHMFHGIQATHNGKHGTRDGTRVLRTDSS